MAYPPTVTKTHQSGDILTASDLNGNWASVCQNMTPENINDYSTNASQCQTIVDPYPGGVVSLATDLSGELARIRYVLAQITGKSYWYVDPPTFAHFTGEASNSVSGAGLGTVTLDLGSVTSGDRIYVGGTVTMGLDGTGGNVGYVGIAKDSGTATVQYHNNASSGGLTFISVPDGIACNNNPIHHSCVVKVTGSGTLVMKITGTVVGPGTNQMSGAQIYAFFLYKQ